MVMWPVFLQHTLQCEFLEHPLLAAIDILLEFIHTIWTYGVACLQ